MPGHFNEIALIILAAGSSSRLGRPKQLLTYKGNTLANQAIQTALTTGCQPVVIVTGALHHQIAQHVISKEVGIIENKDWASGMASSIHCGLQAAEQNQTKKLAGVLIMLCDQPLITEQHLATLCQTFAATGHVSAVATGYADTTGVPAIFPAEMFDDLYHLKGEQGARQLLNNKDITIIPFESAEIDVDTQEDYERLMNLNK